MTPRSGLGIELVPIPAGEFLYGDDKERKYLPGYEIMKYPVTVAQYRQFCQATGRVMPIAPNWGWQDTHPMVNVTWDDASAFAAWTGLALSTEEQWEKAARGMDGWEYPWGNTWDAAKCQCSPHGHYSADAHSTVSVGSFPAGASPYGCLDMAGNVWEWCDSWYEVNKTRVLRGECWIHGDPDTFRAAFRYCRAPTFWNTLNGFRCVSRSPAS